MAGKTKDSGYKVAVFGAKGLIRILLYILAVIFIIFVGRTAYVFGYSIFNEQAMEASPGTDVTVLIPEAPTARQVGNVLHGKGLISDVNIFVAQERFSSYHDKLKGGTYILNTSETPTEMMAIISGENTKGQPSDTSGSDSSSSDTASNTSSLTGSVSGSGTSAGQG